MGHYPVFHFGVTAGALSAHHGSHSQAVMQMTPTQIQWPQEQTCLLTLTWLHATAAAATKAITLEESSLAHQPPIDCLHFGTSYPLDT